MNTSDATSVSEREPNDMERHERGQSRVETAQVLGLQINAGSFQDVVDAIFKAAMEGRSGYVCIANVHMFTLAQRKPSLANAINKADFVTSDGMPLVWALKHKGFKGAERVTGADVMDGLCAMAARTSTPVYLFGGSEATLSTLANTLPERHQGLTLAGTESPPMLPEEPRFDDAVASRLKAAKAPIIFVGLGCPKQEHWMATHAEHVGGIMIGVGAAFDFLAGSVRRAPMWMQRAGLEWLHRLASEPRRLFRRYLVENSYFIYYWLSGKL